MRGRMSGRIMIVAVAVAVAGALPGFAVSAASAAAAKPVLTVKAIDRAGNVAAPDVRLVNVATGASIDMAGQTKLAIPAGTYNVATWIVSPDSSDTLTDQVVTVTASRTVTLDARKGVHIKTTLTGQAVSGALLQVGLMIGSAWGLSTSMGNQAGAIYVVPVASKYLTVYAYAVWDGYRASAHYRYDIVQVFHGGIPASPVIAATQSKLAQVDVTIRKTDANQQAMLMLEPMASMPLGFAAMTSMDPTPVTLITYRTPGFQWQPSVGLDASGGGVRTEQLNMAPYGVGVFHETYENAVLSPGQCMTANVMAHQLRVGLPGACSLIADPLHPDSTASGITQRFQLYGGTKLLASTAGGMATATIPAAKRKYSLQVTADRAAGALISTQITGTWTFVTNGVPGPYSNAVHIYNEQLLPVGLDAANSAAAGSVTPVKLTMTDSFHTVLPAFVKIYASADDGKTWKALSVKKSGNHYVVNVTNPAAGFVSLRIYAGNNKGTSELLTVIHAYAVR